MRKEVITFTIQQQTVLDLLNSYILPLHLHGYQQLIMKYSAMNTIKSSLIISIAKILEVVIVHATRDNAKVLWLLIVQCILMMTHLIQDLTIKIVTINVIELQQDAWLTKKLALAKKGRPIKDHVMIFVHNIQQQKNMWILQSVQIQCVMQRDVVVLWIILPIAQVIH